MTSLLYIGISVLDHVFRVERFPEGAVKHRARDYRTVGGGLAANAAVAAARLGAKVAFATRLGDDLTADLIVADLEREGVDCSLARRFSGHRSPVSSVFVDGNGDRMVLNYGDFTIPDDPDWLPQTLPDRTRAVLGDTRWERGAKHIFTLARNAGVPAVLDVDRAVPDKTLLDTATHVAFSAQAVGELTGMQDPLEGLKLLAAECGNWMAVTLGGDGVYFIDGRVGGDARSDVGHIPAFEVDVVDTLAAGDVWHGAFALALAEGMDERRAVRFASGAAAMKCTRFGGRNGAPRRAELDAFMLERGALN